MKLSHYYIRHTEEFLPEREGGKGKKPPKVPASSQRRR